MNEQGHRLSEYNLQCSLNNDESHQKVLLKGIDRVRSRSRSLSRSSQGSLSSESNCDLSAIGQKVPLQKRKRKDSKRPAGYTPPQSHPMISPIIKEQLSPMASTPPPNLSPHRKLTPATKLEEDEEDKDDEYNDEKAMSTSRTSPNSFHALPYTPPNSRSRAGSVGSRSSLDTIRPHELPLPRNPITTIDDIESPDKTLSPDPSAAGPQGSPRPESPHMYIRSTLGTHGSTNRDASRSASRSPPSGSQANPLHSEDPQSSAAYGGSGGTPFRSENGGNPSQYLSEEQQGLSSSNLRSDEPEPGSSLFRSGAGPESSMYHADDESSGNSSNKNGHNAHQSSSSIAEDGTSKIAGTVRPKTPVSAVLSRNTTVMRNSIANNSPSPQIEENSEPEMSEFHKMVAPYLTNDMTYADLKQFFRLFAVCLFVHATSAYILNWISSTANEYCEKHECGEQIKNHLWNFYLLVQLYCLPFTVNAAIFSFMLNVIEYLVFFILSAVEYLFVLIFDAAQTMIEHPLGLATVILVCLYTELV